MQKCDWCIHNAECVGYHREECILHDCSFFDMGQEYDRIMHRGESTDRSGYLSTQTDIDRRR